MNIKKTIKKNKYLKYPLLIRKCLKDEEFRKIIDACYYDIDNVFVTRQLGPQNKGDIIYFIELNNLSWGFFAYWKETILRLDVAEKLGFVPIIKWGSKCPYYNQGMSRGGNNPFEYYFEPASNITVADAMKSARVIFSNNFQTDKHFQHYADYGYQQQLDKWIYYNQKYIHLKSNVQNKIIKEMTELISNKTTLAIHVRGVEWGNIKNHPIPARLNEYYDRIDSALEKYGFEQIFIATDSDDATDSFKQRYGSRIVFYGDVLRTPKGSKTLMIFDSSTMRKNNSYKMGYEILRDMLTLSMCDGLIAGESNVSFAARVFKESRGEKYTYTDLLTSQKVCKKGISLDKAVKEMKRN